LYGMSKVLGHQCLSVSAIVANRIAKNFTEDGDTLVEKMIKKSLDIISSIED
jgi:uridine phosphorylase